MQTHDYLLLAVAALIIAAAFAFSPNSVATGNSIQHYRIDLSGLGRNSGYVPEEEIPAH